MSNEDGLIRLNNVRLSFPTLVTPKAFATGQPEKYSCDFILEADDPAFTEFTTEGARLCVEAFGEKAKQIIAMIKGNKKLRAFADGEEKIKSDGTQYQGYEGMKAISANTTDQPDMYDANGEKLMNATKLYGGCYVNAYVKPWVQNNKYGKAIRCDLVAVQFVADGEPFGGGRPNTEGLFGAVEGAPESQADYEANEDGSFTF